MSVFSVSVPDHEDMEQFRVLFQIRPNRDINLTYEMLKSKFKR